MRFDWYQATVSENPVVLVDTIKARLGDGGEVQEGRGRHNYHQSFTIFDREGDRAATVLCGGPNGNPNVSASGEATEAFVELIRDCWPSHRVTRFDSAEDFIGEESYDRLEAVCRGVAKASRVKGRAIVPDDLSDGRTYYMGAASSDVRVRLYDKAAETRSKLPAERHGEVPIHWSRLEAQVRPRDVQWKTYGAHCRPEDVWGMSGWTRELALHALSLSLEKVTMRVRADSDLQRIHRVLVEQYGAHIQELVREHGSAEMWFRTLVDDVKKVRTARRLKRGMADA
jgi:Putative phage replication protein RstA